MPYHPNQNHLIINSVKVLILIWFVRLLSINGLPRKQSADRAESAAYRPGAELYDAETFRRIVPVSANKPIYRSRAKRQTTLLEENHVSKEIKPGSAKEGKSVLRGASGNAPHDQDPQTDPGIPTSSSRSISNGGYIVEMMPQDSESLQHDQWIYLRICTKPAKVSGIPRLADTFEDEIREELQHSSCVASDIGRPKFSRGQELVITIRGKTAVSYAILDNRLQLSSTVFSADRVKFWSVKSLDTVLIGLRPPSYLNNDVLDIHLEQPVNSEPHFQTKPYLASSTSVWSRTNRLKLFRLFGVPFSEREVYHAEKSDHQLLGTQNRPKIRIHLKQILIQFTAEPRQLFIRCNKSGPIAVFDPFTVKTTLANTQTSLDTEKSATRSSNGLKGFSMDDAYKAAEPATSINKEDQDSGSAELTQPSVDQATNTPKSRLFVRLSPGLPSMIWDSEVPEPVTVGELMDEISIHLAQKRMQSSSPDPLPLEMYLPTSSALLVPTEPITRTLVYVVSLGETVHITCQGRAKLDPIIVLYEQDAWANISQTLDKQLPSSVGPKIDHDLKAVRITWDNVSETMLNQPLRFADQLTSVKCGYHKQGHLWEPHISPAILEDASVVQLSFTIVSPTDYHLINQWLAAKHSQTFGVQPPEKPATLEQTILQFASAFRVDRHNFTNSFEHRHVGFWNISLSTLSAMKLVMCFITAIFVITLIILAICHYSQPRGVNCSSINLACLGNSESEQLPQTWDSGDQAVPRQPTFRRIWIQTVLDKIRRRRSTPNNVTPAIGQLQPNSTGSNVHLAYPMGSLKPGEIVNGPEGLWNGRYRARRRPG
ncbi:hypothetical protein CSKR_204040 [Clonorchis sinensis]|uniref:Uncharacterized protein n=1 Tax=Clonorchis sinensis TaxID=79923 RepID=A0A8T1MVB1_CLOSI|nr:hypothetical protein CSKR_204040 [Clonorchis sinensis]